MSYYRNFVVVRGVSYKYLDKGSSNRDLEIERVIRRSRMFGYFER